MPGRSLRRQRVSVSIRRHRVRDGSTVIQLYAVSSESPHMTGPDGSYSASAE